MKKSITRIMAALALLVTLAIPMGVWGQAPVGTTLWGETWTGGDANETPSAYGFEGTTVYGGATLTYAQSSTNTKLYEEALAGGESPELLLSKSNQTWTISNIPTGQATGMALTFNSNKTTFDVTSTTTGITISGSQKSWTIAATSSVTTFNLTIKNTGSSNARIDDIVLSVTTAGGDTPQPTTYTVTYDCNGGTSGCPQNVTGIEPNTQIQLADAPSKDGFDFDGWSDGNTTYGENEDYTVTGNVTFTAQWTENTTPTPGGITATLNIQAYAAANNWENGVKYTTATVAPVTFTANGGGNTGKYYTNGQDWRFYQNESASITISVAEGYTLVSVKPTFSVSNGGVLKNGNATIESGTTVSVSGTSVTFTVGNSGSATNGQVRFTNIDVVYVSNGGVIPPSITANNVEITYDTDADEIEYEINNAVDGGVLTAGTESDWLTLGEVGATVPFTCSVNEAGTERTATVTLTYTYNRAIVTKDVTVTQAGNPNVTMTIAEVREQGTGNVVTIGTVTSFSVNNNNTTAYIQDASAAIVVYGNFTTAVGDEIRVSGTLSTYHGLLEITNPEVTVISQGNTVNPEVMTVAEAVASTNQGWYIRIEDATVTEIEGQNTTIAQGENTIVVRGISGVEYVVNDVLSLNGNIGCYDGNQIANPQNVEVQAAPAVPSITFNPDVVNVDAEEHDGTLDFTYENLTITDMTDFDIQYYDAEGEETETPDWIEVLVAEQDPGIGEGYVVSYYMFENEGEARSAYFKVYAMDDETNLVYSNLVTISQAAPVVPPTPGTWVLTSLADLTEDDIFVIVGTYEDLEHDSYAMSNDKGTSGAPTAVSVTIVGNTLSGEPDANIQWNISGNATDGYIFYPNGTTESWLYCTNTNNGVRVGTNEANNVFTMSENGYLHNTATERYIGIYNSQDWRCYTSEGGNIAGQTFAFYKKVAAATETYPLDIIGYEAGSDGGYYLIASPVTVNPANVGMTDGEYDLYSFDQAEADEWRNYKVNAFNLEPGKGYLYAKQATTEGEVFHFELTGTPYNGEPITLSRSENVDFPGWNLVGNPFGQTAYIDRDFYVMKSDGSEIIESETNEIDVMQGVFVIATNDGEVLTFSTEAPTTTDGKIVMNVSNARRSVVDRATVRFGEGRTLPKFMLNDENTKIYFTEGNEEFAVVRSINENLTPVSFHAAENGTYTLSVNAENVDFSFFHLIDNMTGNDIDLLSTPSYTFEASTTDYAQRFSLLYATLDGVGENNAEVFAFFNGNEWVVNNEGEANLQVIDMTGRLISSETVNGTATVSLNQSAGIYMLRLVNGNNVKVQKVVVR